MARSIEYWYNVMVEEKQTFNTVNGLMPLYDLQPPTPDNPFLKLLNEITTKSKVAVWKGWIWIVATGMFLLDQFWDETKAEQEEIAAASVAFNQKWWCATVKKWQYGDALIMNPNTFRYYYADEVSADAIAKRLVVQVSAVEVNTGNGMIVVLKVRGADGQLDDTPGTEEQSLNSYILEVKPAGVQTALVNLPSDKLRLNIKRYYDGTLILNDFKTTDEAALNSFLQNIEFNGVLYLRELEDALQAVVGSKKPWCYVISAEAKADTEVVWTTITEEYNPVSGWLELVAIGNTVGVDTVIEYVPV